MKRLLFTEIFPDTQWQIFLRKSLWCQKRSFVREVEEAAFELETFHAISIRMELFKIPRRLVMRDLRQPTRASRRR